MGKCDDGRVAPVIFYYFPNHIEFVLKYTTRGVNNPLEYGQIAPSSFIGYHLCF